LSGKEVRHCCRLQLKLHDPSLSCLVTIRKTRTTQQ